MMVNPLSWLKGLVFASYLAISGCFLPGLHDKDPSITFHADKRFSDPERQCIRESANQWRDQTSGLANVKVEYDYDPTSSRSVVHHHLADRMVRWTSQTPELVEYEKHLSEEAGEPVFILGQVHNKLTDTIRTPIEVRLVMDRLENPHACKLTTVHEFGHVFGLDHIDNKSNIMYPSVDVRRSACLKHDELLAFAWKTDQPFELMKPCPDDEPERFLPVRVGTDEPLTTH